MDERTTAGAAETETLKAVYAALNRNDVGGMVELLDPDVEWTEPADRSGGRNCRGRAELTAHVAQARATWAEGSCEPERFIVAGDKVVALAHVRVRLVGESEWIEGDVTDVWTFRDGKAVGGRSFDDRRQALQWAGVEATA